MATMDSSFSILAINIMFVLPGNVSHAWLEEVTSTDRYNDGAISLTLEVSNALRENLCFK